MRVVEARNPGRGTVLGAKVRVADRWWLRLRGLLGRSGLAEGEGLLIEPVGALQDERRPRDVGEQAGHPQRGNQYKDHEPLVAHEFGVGRGDAAHP